MKIFRSASLFLVMFLLCGVNIEASTPKVTVSESGEVQVSDVGNNIIGLELTLELSDGSFQNTAFTPLANSSYTFEKVSGNKITIYSTGSDDLSNNGTVILGTIKTTSGAVFASGTTLNLVGASLAQNIYANVPVVSEKKNVTTGGTGTGGTSTGTTTNSSTTDTTDTTESDQESEDIEGLVEDTEVDEELYLEEHWGTDDYVSNDSGVYYNDDIKEKSSWFKWLFLLMLVIVGTGVIFYLNGPKELKVRKGVIHPEEEDKVTPTKAQKDYNDLYVKKEYEGTDMTQYQEW